MMRATMFFDCQTESASPAGLMPKHLLGPESFSGICKRSIEETRLHSYTAYKSPYTLAGVKENHYQQHNLRLKTSNKRSQVYSLIHDRYAKVLKGQSEGTLQMSNRSITQDPFFALRDQTLKKLQDKLRSDKFFNIKLNSEDQDSKKPLYIPTEGNLLAIQREFLNENLDVGQIINKYLGGQESCLILQKYLEVCQLDDFAKAKRFIECNLDHLMQDKRGNFLIQKCCQRDAQFTVRVSEHCRREFWSYAFKEETSRLLQYLIENLSMFRKFALTELSSNMESVIQNFSATFLFTIVIKSSEVEAEYAFVTDLIRKCGSCYLQSKYFKRIVVSYLEYCSYGEISKVYEMLGIRNNYLDMLNDRFFSFILLMLLKRQFKPFVEAFCQGIRINLTSLLKTKYFKFMITKCKSTNCVVLLNRIHQALVGVPPSIASQIGKRRGVCYFYSYIVLLTVADSPIAIKDAMNYLDRQFKLGSGLQAIWHKGYENSPVVHISASVSRAITALYR